MEAEAKAEESERDGKESYAAMNAYTVETSVRGWSAFHWSEHLLLFLSSSFLLK